MPADTPTPLPPEALAAERLSDEADALIVAAMNAAYLYGCADESEDESDRGRLWSIRHAKARETDAALRAHVASLESEIRRLTAEGERAPKLWTCPDCGFAFDAMHTDQATGGYSCPCCAERALTAERERDEAREWVREMAGRTCETERGYCTTCGERVPCVRQQARDWLAARTPTPGGEDAG